MREPLRQGMTITVSCEGVQRQYQIDKTIGEGACGIAYDAHRIGNKESVPRCRIKECYPVGTGVKRVGTELLWANAEFKDNAFARLRKAHELTITLRDDPLVGNNITSAELCEGNGTIYSIMEVNHATTYAEKQDIELKNILKTMRVLSDAVGNLHTKGYLHLDLKPDNFLVTYNPNISIWFFDTDSLIAMEDLRERKIHGVSYSEGYGAPEQANWRPQDLGPASDVYSIGAMLFERIMKRAASCADRGIFAQWEFDGELFGEVNPQIKRQLEEIFVNTLAAYPGARYQTAKQLSAALLAAERLLEKPYLISKYPITSCGFVGREKEIKLIEQVFSEGEHIVFLQGIGGIGKSELAKRYAKLHEKSYNAILFEGHTESIKAWLDGLKIQNFSGNQEERRKCLPRLLDQNILLIIDGYDQVDDDDWEVLEQLRCHVIVTSRLDWGEYGVGRSLEINALSIEKQMELFELELGRQLDEEEKKLAEQLFHDIEGYTLLLPLLAKQMAKGYFDFNSAKSKLSVAGLKGISHGKIRHQKDGKRLVGPLYDVLKTIFSFAQFTEEQRTIMRSLILPNRYQIEQSIFLEWSEGLDDKIDAIDDLCFQGWIHRELLDNTIFLGVHAVIADLLREELNPTIINSLPLKTHIENLANSFETRNRQLDVGISIYTERLQYRQMMKFNYVTGYDCVELIKNILSREIEYDDALFWADIIAKIARPELEAIIELRENLQEMWNILPSTDLTAIRARAKVAFALTMCGLIRHDFDMVYKNILYIKDSIEDVPERFVLQFHVCFTFYQYLSYIPILKELQEIPWYSEAWQCVKELWGKLVVTYPYDGSDNDVFVISNAGCAKITKLQMQQAYDSFCTPTSGRVYREVEPEDDTSSGCWSFDSNSLYGEAAAELKQIKELKDVDTVQRYANQSITAISDSLPYDTEVSTGSLIIHTTHRLSDSQRQVLSDKLRRIDKQCPIARERFNAWEWNFVQLDLASMEAMYAYAYALLDDWSHFDLHLKKLMEYYKAIWEKEVESNSKGLQPVSDVVTFLPGLRLLMNKYGDVLPYQRAMEIYHVLSKMAEQIFLGFILEKEVLFNIYKAGWMLAQRGESPEYIALYRRKLQAISDVGAMPKE